MYNPERYGVIDIFAWYALTGEDRENRGFDYKDWMPYLKQIRDLAKKHGKTARQIDMALMMYGQEIWKK